MSFRSILFEQAPDLPEPGRSAAPQALADLNLDQVCSALTLGRDQYDLAPYFLTPLHDEAAIYYRHQVLRDLRTGDVRAAVAAFARGLTTMRQGLAQVSRLGHRYQQQRWFLDAANTYGQAVLTLAQQLRDVELKSAGLVSLREYLETYLQSAEYQQLTASVADLLDRLRDVRYCVHIKANRVRVTRYEGEEDYGAEVERTFAKFAESTRSRMSARRSARWPEMDHVEARILDGWPGCIPELFDALDEFRARHAAYLDDTIVIFDREVQFYAGYLEFIAPMKTAGLEFCYPGCPPSRKEIQRPATRSTSRWRPSCRPKARRSSATTSAHRPRAHLRRHRPEPGRQDHVRADVRPAALPGQPRLPGPGPSGSPVRCPTGSSPISRRRKTWPRCAGKLEDELVRIHDILGRRPAAASSS